VSLVDPYNPESTNFNVKDARLAGIQGFLTENYTLLV
jgi:hypothetical protein